MCRTILAQLKMSKVSCSIPIILSEVFNEEETSSMEKF